MTIKLATTKKEIKQIEYFNPTDSFNGFIIVPYNDLHDSGWKTMKYILLKGMEVVGCVGGYCDVVHLNGIGGRGKDMMATQSAIGWCIDCLPCGYLRVFCNKALSLDSFIGSNFIVYVEGDIR